MLMGFYTRQQDGPTRFGWHWLPGNMRMRHTNQIVRLGARMKYRDVWENRDRAYPPRLGARGMHASESMTMESWAGTVLCFVVLEGVAASESFSAEMVGTHRTVLAWWDSTDGKGLVPAWVRDARARNNARGILATAQHARSKWLAEHPTKARLASLDLDLGGK